MDQDTGVSHADPAVRREAIGSWITTQIDRLKLDRTAVAKAVGVSAATLRSWEAGEGEVSLEQAFGLDDVFGEPVGSTAFAGGYVGVRAVAHRSGDGGFGTREFGTSDEMLEELDAAMTLGLGFSLHNVMVEVDRGERWVETEERWLLNLSWYPRDEVTTTI